MSVEFLSLINTKTLTLVTNIMTNLKVNKFWLELHLVIKKVIKKKKEKNVLEARNEVQGTNELIKTKK